MTRQRQPPQAPQRVVARLRVAPIAQGAGQDSAALRMTSAAYRETLPGALQRHAAAIHHARSAGRRFNYRIRRAAYERYREARRHLHPLRMLQLERAVRRHVYGPDS